jgi:MFS family permease
MSTDAAPFRWRSVLLQAFAPALLFATGEGAIIPVIPLLAEDLGASLAVAGVVASLIVVGTLVGDLPSGVLVARIGERNAMIAAALVASGGLGLCLLAPQTGDAGLPLLALGVLLVGVATAVFGLARQAFLTSMVPAATRARALSTLGGTFRAGFFIGPFLAAGAISTTGSTASVFVIHLVACLAVVVLLLVVPDPTEAIRQARTAPPSRPVPRIDDDGRGVSAPEQAGLLGTIRRNRRVLLGIGTGAALLQALRSSRQVILPLVALAIGLDDATTALVIGIAGGVDFALFYVSGAIMDRFGRLYSVVPAMAGLSITHLLLALTFSSASPSAWFIGVAVAMSVANGVGSGIVMTLGSDLAGRRDPAPFLGAWRFVGDTGQAVAPLVISAVTALVSLPAAAVVMAVVGAAGAVQLVVLLPRYLPTATRRPQPGD